jgi:Ca2+:H+ antiporter
LYSRYIFSRFFLHNPPGEENVFLTHPNAPEALAREEHELLEGEPEVNQYVCIAVLIFSIGIMAATAEWVSQCVIFVVYTHVLNVV